MKPSVNRILVVLAALTVVTMGMGLALAVQTTDSTDATNVGAVEASDWQDDGSTVITDFNGSSDSYANVSVKVPADNATDGFEMTVSHDGATHLELDETSSQYVLVGESLDTDGDGTATDNTDVHAWNFSHDQLSTIPGEPGENTTVTVNVTNYASDGSVNGTQEFDVTLTFASDHSVLYLADGTTAFEDVDVTEQTAGTFESWLGTEDSDVPDHYVLDTTTNVTNSSGAEVYLGDDMAGNYSDSVSDASDGDLLIGMGALVTDEDGDDVLAPIYYEEAGDSIDTDSDVYGVYHESSDKVEFHNLPDGEVDIRMANHQVGSFEGVSFDQLWSHSAFDLWGALQAWSW